MAARGLPNRDWTLRCGEGVSDPYCICEIPGKACTKIKTPVVEDSLNPLWNFEATISDYSVGDSLEFTVWDKDEGKKDDLMGRAVLTSAQLVALRFEGELLLGETGKKAPSFLVVRVTDAEVDQLGELMRTLGPRYKALPHGRSSELAKLWSQETLLQRRLRHDAELKAASSSCKGSHHATSKLQRANSEAVVSSYVYTNAHNSMRFHGVPQRSDAPSAISPGGNSLNSDFCRTWHGKPNGLAGRPDFSSGQSAHRFAASRPVSHHPAIHPGAADMCM